VPTVLAGPVSPSKRTGVSVTAHSLRFGKHCFLRASALADDPPVLMREDSLLAQIQVFLFRAAAPVLRSRPVRALSGLVSLLVLKAVGKDLSMICRREMTSVVSLCQGRQKVIAPEDRAAGASGMATFT